MSIPNYINSKSLKIIQRVIGSVTLLLCHLSLTIIPRARMDSESIAHEAEVRMGYRLGGHESERTNCVSKIQLVGQKYPDKTTLAS